MTDQEFEALVAAGVEAIPEKYLKMLKNVRIVVEDRPTRIQLENAKVGPGHTLFGLYEGVPQPARGGGYNLVLPDKITIFREPILAACGSPEEVFAQVRETVWHEIAHHFGFDEAAVAARSRAKRDRKRSG